jgi:hypothetical protein
MQCPAEKYGISNSSIRLSTNVGGDVKLETSRLYLPARMPVVTIAEIMELEEIMPTKLQKLDDIHSRNLRTSANLRC